MRVEADDGLPTTASASEFRGAETVVVLRWVYPPRDLVTVLADSPVVLGRAPSSTTQLDTERVSRRHAELSLASGTRVVRDLNSKNGVFVNGERVRESPLGIGDVLRLGDCVAVVDTATLDGLSGFRDLGNGILGGSAMASVVERVRRTALEGNDLLLEGEVGCGRGLLARAYHRFARRVGPFVAFECMPGNDGSQAAELFGRAEDGVGAGEQPSLGQVRVAEGGTLLLEDVFDLPADLQSKLAHVMERRAVVPLGGERTIAVDVRFAATSSGSSDKRHDTRPSAQLRERFEGSLVRVPPLRERRSDIVPLFLSLLGRRGHAARPLEPELAEALCLHDWPMNVRELDSMVRRLSSRSEGGELRLEHVGGSSFGSAKVPRTPLGSQPAAPRRTAAAYSANEVAALRAALERHGGNLTKAANELEITRSKAYRMLKMT